MGVALFERDLELRAGRTFLEASPARALVIDGPAGIGKTAVLRSVIEIARGDGHLVLECTADSAEVRLTFVGLADLFGTVADEVLDQLPTPQAHALEVALLRADAESPGEPHAVAAGVLSTLRALAERQQVLVAIDDIQWLDGASAEAITFAARRLSSSRVRFLLARRPRTPTQLERAIEPDLTRLSVAPLSLGSMRRMLKDRLGLTLPRHLLSQIFGATLGNPLFALEFGRTLAEQGLPALGEELPMPETVEALLGARVTGLPRPVHRLLLALALGGDLDTSKLAGIAEPGTVDEASERGLVVADVHRVRASHPLLAAAIKKQSKGRERRELHLTLASVAADDALRAHHLALASRQPDEKLAEMVAAAAGRAFARGARREALSRSPRQSATSPQQATFRRPHLMTTECLDALAPRPPDPCTPSSRGSDQRRMRKWGAARRSLELAARTFDEIGSTGWADRARFEIDRIGARRPGRAGELTSTERRVVELAANGRSNKEIAQALFVAISTVEGHLSRAYGKLGVRSRAQLAHQVTRDGFPEVQPKS